MEKILYKVSFEILTSQYTNTPVSFEHTVLAISYDDAANKVANEFGIYDKFKLGTITPAGIPRKKAIKLANSRMEDFYRELDITINK